MREEWMVKLVWKKQKEKESKVNFMLLKERKKERKKENWYGRKKTYIRRKNDKNSLERFKEEKKKKKWNGTKERKKERKYTS